MADIYNYPALCLATQNPPACFAQCQGLEPVDGCCIWQQTATLRTASHRGDYRLANDSLGRWELYHDTGAWPDLAAAPEATFTSSPHETGALSYPATHYFVLRKRNVHDLVSQNEGDAGQRHYGDGFACWILELDSSGDQVVPSPSDAENTTLAATSGGTVRVQAQYPYAADASYAADQFLIYLTSDGSDPDPEVDSPTVVDMVKVDGIAKLNWTSGAFGNGSTVKVIVRTRRSGTPNYDSSSTTILSTTASTSGPAAPSGRALFDSVAEQHQ